MNFSYGSTSWLLFKPAAALHLRWRANANNFSKQRAVVDKSLFVRKLSPALLVGNTRVVVKISLMTGQRHLKKPFLTTK